MPLNKMDAREDSRTTAWSGNGVTPGRLFIISGPSGVGKTTLRRMVLNHLRDLRYSVSHTTRAPREGERHGLDYYFISQDRFLEKIKQNQWAEWAHVHGCYYGTAAEFIDGNMASGHHTLLDIDVQGTSKLLKRYPTAVTVFIMPPSLDVLEVRLRDRASEDEEVIAQRLAEARNELRYKDHYRHVVINDRLSRAASQLVDLISGYGC